MSRTSGPLKRSRRRALVGGEKHTPKMPPKRPKMPQDASGTARWGGMGLVWGSGARWGGVWRGAEEVDWIQALFAELRLLEMQPHLPSQAPAPSSTFMA